MAQLPDLDGSLRSIKTWHAEVDQQNFVDRLPRVDELGKVLDSFDASLLAISLDALNLKQAFQCHDVHRLIINDKHLLFKLSVFLVCSLQLLFNHVI